MPGADGKPEMATGKGVASDGRGINEAADAVADGNGVIGVVSGTF